MSRMSRVLSLSVAAAIGLCVDAHADHWRVCNKTTEELFVAVGYHDKQNETVSRGWGTVAPCGCLRALEYDKTDSQTVYLYAENKAGVAKFTSGSPHFCVSNPGPFAHRNGPGNSCGGKVVGFDKVTLRSWPNVFTTNLEGNGTCSIDPG
jgi:uncharacterized membrane protein